MINPFIPAYVYEKKQRRFSALIMVLALTPLIVFNLTRNVSATQTHTWDSSDFSAGVYSNTEMSGGDITLPHAASSTVDTDWNDFYAGDNYFSPLSRTAVVEDGDVEISQSYAYTETGTPSLVGNTGRSVFKEGDVLYIGSWKSLSMIDTQSTLDPDDDVLLGHYSTTSTPAMLSNGNIMAIKKYGNLIYIADYNNGLYVFDTAGTANVSDDTLITRYHTGSSPALASNIVRDLLLVGDVLYAVTHLGVSAIDTKGTNAAGDDTLVIRYYSGSTPSIGGNYAVQLISSGNLLYIVSPGVGVVVINTQGTITSADDVVVGTYNNASFSAIPSANPVGSVSLKDDLVYIRTYRNPVVIVIDTKGTETFADDETVATYGFQTEPSIEPSYFPPVTFVGDLLQVGSYSGFKVIDTNGTGIASDDSVVTEYNRKSNPNITQPGEYLDDNGQLYISSYLYGLSVLTPGLYRPSGLYESLPRRIADISTTSITMNTTSGDGQSVQLSYRTGGSAAAWRDDFNNLDSYAGDLYGWTNPFSVATTSGGILRLSNPITAGLADAWIDTGYSDDYFPAGSVVTARVRIVNPQPSEVLETWMFTDDWWSDDALLSQNEWTTMKTITTSDDAFSDIGFEIYARSGNAIPAGTTLEIDWIEVTTPDSMGEWGSWTACSGSTCVLADLGSAQWLQYKLDLTTTDTSTTPVVHSVSYNGDYISTGTYTSGTQTFDRAQDLVTFNAVDTTPDGTGITYEFSTDEGDTWQSITPGTTLSRFDVVTDTFMWRATLSTLDPAYAPTIESVTLTTSVHENPTHTSLQTQLDKLEENGNHEAVLRLKEKYPHFFDGTASDTEIRLQMILILREALALLETSPKNSE